jgi:Trk K+ transport system NAD-binding subunit
MAPTNLLTLCKNGDPQAIAALFNRSLQGRAQTTVDWQGGQLNLRFESADRLQAETLLAFVRRTLQTLRIDAVQVLRVYAYQVGTPIPLWTETLNLEADALPDAPILVDSTADKPLIDRFLVCGLGGLGQYSVYSLKRFALREFEIRVTAIDRMEQTDWEVQDLPSLLDEPPIIGDCRDDQILLKAGVQECRAILLVTSDESVNIETALAARRLNPKIRLIVRSSRQSLNQLLKQQFVNFVAFEPTELPANAFTLAGLGAGILGFFDIGDRRLQVVEQQVEPRDYRFDGFPADALLHKKTYRLLSHTTAQVTELPNRAFYQWQLGTKVQAGDRVAFIEVVDQRQMPIEMNREKQRRSVWQKIQDSGGWGEVLAQTWMWLQAKQTRLVVSLGLATSLLLWIVGTVILKANVPGLSWTNAISAAAILLLGGYGDLFGGLQQDVTVPDWVQLACLMITLISLLFILGVFGLITDTLISSRFNFFRKRLPIPQQNHIVLVGFGRVGQRIAALLQDFKQPFVAITEQADLLPKQPIALLVGAPIAELSRTNLATAKSVIAVTEDQMVNLEVALLARNANRNIGVVVRTYDQRFSDNLKDFMPDARALAAYALSAEAFASAAFGENVLGLFRLNQQTILVTEYCISANDTLVGKSLAQVAYGYGVVPVYHQELNVMYDSERFLLPADERVLDVGDRLIVLSSINGLRRIEHGDITFPERWRLEVSPPLNPIVLHDCSSLLFRISGCDLEQARTLMANLPGTIELDLYDHQAYHLEQELGKQLPLKLQRA